MTSLFASFNIARQGLLINQSALGVVSNNISNMNTTGYSKQRVDFESTGYLEIKGARNQTYQIGSGAQIGSIVRYREAYLDSSYRDESSNYSYYSNLYKLSSLIESSMNELSGSGLDDAISDFYTAVDTLNATPADSTARMNFVQKAKVLATQFNQIATTLTNNRTATVGNIDDPQSIHNSQLSLEVGALNDKLKQLADINEKIVKTTSMGSPSNPLLDERDNLLDEISSYIQYDLTENKNGSVTLTMNGMNIVKGTEYNQFDITLGDFDNPSVIQLKNADGDVIKSNINDQFIRGSIASYLEMGGNVDGTLSFQTMLNQINNLAVEFSNTINGIQTFNDGAGNQAMAIGFDADGNKILSDYGGLPPIFASKDGQPLNALNIAVSDEISNDYWQIAAARVDTADPEYSNLAVGNSDNIKLFSNSRNNSIAGLNNMTFEKYLTKAVTEMGSAIESTEFNLKSQASLFSAADTERQSAIGVNLDEELMDLVKYQRAYEASARIFSVTSSLLETLVNLGR